MSRTLIALLTAAPLVFSGCKSIPLNSQNSVDTVVRQECRTCVEDNSLLGPNVTPFYVHCDEHDRYSLAGWYYRDVDGVTVVVHYGTDVILDSHPREGYVPLFVTYDTPVQPIRDFFGLQLRHITIGQISLPWNERIQMKLIQPNHIEE